MSYTPHALSEDFPDLADRLQEMRDADPHFARLLSDYDEINETVYAAETNVSPVGQIAETEMRKKRAFLKDEIYRMLTAPA